MRKKARVRVILVSSIALAASLVLLAGNVIPVDETLASWNDSSFVQSTFTAGVVSPALLLACTVANPYLAPVVTFTWSVPEPGATRSHYRWYLSSSADAAIDEGTLDKDATSYEVTQTIDYGTINFRLVAEGQGTWQSTSVMGTVSRVLLQGVSCEAPTT